MIKNVRILNFIILSGLLTCLIGVTSCASQGVTSLEQGNDHVVEAEDNAVDITKSTTSLVDITMEGGSGKAYIKSLSEMGS